ncbi:TlpA family protein disulfide reductase [Aquimarina sp. 2201CG14-23]|uniref:TlpA family protein disulfide reductase n=1 Tax=Aquimarina mycalae TaxID=3040073 RepID=UPI0024781A1E|nr:TlpA disulfide reductase family protein [Aquimarina sp. 2201CG14-23]MDH7445256.1 TlpA disulfide reductase family protein [Aquimarina sp. 2201CG14-23]
MKKILQYIFVSAIVLFGLFYVYTKWAAANEGDPAPDFETTLVDGTPFKLSNLQGKYVLLDFWGSWCPPCIKESPELVALHQKHADQLTIVTVALEKNKDSWKKVVSKYGYTWKNQIVSQNRFVMLSDIARKYGVSEIPAKFLISPEGNLIGNYSFEEIDRLLSDN